MESTLEKIASKEVERFKLDSKNSPDLTTLYGIRKAVLTGGFSCLTELEEAASKVGDGRYAPALQLLSRFCGES